MGCGLIPVTGSWLIMEKTLTCHAVGLRDKLSAEKGSLLSRGRGQWGPWEP